MESDWYRFGETLGEVSLLLAALLFLLWGFQQRQVYEKRQQGTLTLTIGGSLLVAFCLSIAIPELIGSSADTDDRAATRETDLAMSQTYEITRGAESYLRAIDQVRVKVTTDDGFRVDVTYIEDEDAVGTVSNGDAKIRFRRIGDDMFFSPNEEFWTAQGTPEAIDYIDGRWIRADVDDKRWAQLTRMPDRAQLLDPLMSTQTLTLGEPATIRGVECQVLKIGRTGGLLYISGSPRRMLRFDDGDGLIEDLDYDSPEVTPTAPSRIVEASEVLGSRSAA